MVILTDDVEEPDLGLHRVGVELAHVPSLVVFLDVVDVEPPSGLVPVEWHPEPGDASRHLVVDCQDHLPVDVHPRHLKRDLKKKNVKMNYTIYDKQDS